MILTNKINENGHDFELNESTDISYQIHNYDDLVLFNNNLQTVGSLMESKKLEDAP